MNDNPKRRENLQTVQNAIQILRLFTIEQPEWGVREMAKLTGLTTTTTHRLLSSLVSEGFLCKNEKTKRYRLGLEFFTIGGVVQTNLILHSEAHPFLESLVQDVEENALVAVLEGEDIIYLDKVECKHAVGLKSFVGKRHPAHCTASGKLLLAYHPEKQINRIISKGLRPYTDHTVTDPVVLKQQLNEIRKTGYCVCKEELYEEVMSIAVPIFDYSMEVIASVTIVGFKQRMLSRNVDHCIEKLILTGERISEKMGYLKKKLQT